MHAIKNSVKKIGFLCMYLCIKMLYLIIFLLKFDFKNDCEFTNIFSKFANEQI